MTRTPAPTRPLLSALGMEGKVYPRAYPELHEEKGIGGSPFKELLEPALLLWEFVIDLADVHGFEVGVAVARAGLADVHEQVLVVLWREEWSEREAGGGRTDQETRAGAHPPRDLEQVTSLLWASVSPQGI